MAFFRARARVEKSKLNSLLDETVAFQTLAKPACFIPYNKISHEKETPTKTFSQRTEHTAADQPARYLNFNIDLNLLRRLSDRQSVK